MDQITWCTVDDVMSDLLIPLSLRGVRACPGDKDRIDKNFIVVGEKPPPNLLTEETEEEIRNSRNVDVVPPDLSLIKQMLHMAKENNTMTSEKLCNQTDEQIISKIKENPEIEPEPKSHDEKEKNCSNVALKSLLLKLGKSKIRLHSEERTLLTPTDIVNASTLTSVSCEKVTNNIQTIPSKDSYSKPPKQLILNPTIMFRKRIKPLIPEKEVMNESVLSSSAAAAPSLLSVPQMYIPSEFALEKYNEFMERNAQKAKQANYRNNLQYTYTLLKRIDALSVNPNINKHPSLSEDEFNRLKPVLLSAHRHLIQEDCCTTCIIRAKITNKDCNVNRILCKKERQNMNHNGY